jgi:hypothetical protein
MTNRGKSRREGGEEGSRPLLFITYSSEPSSSNLSVVVAYPFCYGTITSLFYFSLFFPSHYPLQPTIRHYRDLPDSPGHVAVRSKNQEPREEPKQSKPKGTRSVTCWYPPLPFALLQYTSHSTPKAHFSSYPTSTPLLPSLGTPPTPRTHIQLQTIKVKHLKVSKHGRGPFPPSSYLKHPSVPFSLPLPPLSSIPAFTPPPS